MSYSTTGIPSNAWINQASLIQNKNGTDDVITVKGKSDNATPLDSSDDTDVALTLTGASISVLENGKSAITGGTVTQVNGAATSIKNTGFYVAPEIDMPPAGLATWDAFTTIQLFAESIGVDLSSTASAEEAMAKLLSHSSVALLLSHVCSKSLSDVLKSMAKVSESEKDSIALSSQNKLEKIMEDIKKQQEAKKSGLMGEIFGWLATSLAVVTAVITMQPALIAAAIIMVTMQSLSQAKVKVNEIAQWTMTGVSIVLSLGACMPATMAKMGLGVVFQPLSKSLAGATSAIGIAVKKSYLVQAGVKLMQSSPKLFALLQISEGASTVIQGSFGINSAILNKEDAALRAAMKRIEAFLLLVQDSIEKSTDLIDDLVKKFQDMLEVFASILSASISAAAPAPSAA